MTSTEATNSKKIISFSKNNKRNHLLVFGYIRNNAATLKLMYNIPDGIKQIILKYILFNDFKFDRPAECFDISDDELAVTLKDTKYGTIQFGQFLNSSDKLIYRVKFLMEKVSQGNIGFGFITPEFDKWDHAGYFNNCEANCVTLYSNSFYEGSPDFIEINEQYPNQAFVAYGEDIYNYMQCESGDHVVIEMNMTKLNANIIFYTRVTKDDQVAFEKNQSFTINLLNEVAIIVDAGVDVQTVRVIEQSFEYL